MYMCIVVACDYTTLSVHYYLPIAIGRRDGFVPFSRALTRMETQTFNSISNDYNRYAKSASLFLVFFCFTEALVT